MDNWQQKVNPPIQEFKRANIYFNYTPQITRKAIASVQHRFIECNECIDEIPQNNSCFCPSIDQKNPWDVCILPIHDGYSAIITSEKSIISMVNICVDTHRWMVKFQICWVISTICHIYIYIYIYIYIHIIHVHIYIYTYIYIWYAQP